MSVKCPEEPSALQAVWHRTGVAAQMQHLAERKRDAPCCTCGRAQNPDRLL